MYLSTSYERFLEYLPYLDDNIVTSKLEEYANNLLNGFDISLDVAVGDILQPTRVNLREVFIEEKELGGGRFSAFFTIHSSIFNTYFHLSNE